MQPALHAGSHGNLVNALFDRRRGVAGRFDPGDDRGQELGFIGFDLRDEAEHSADAGEDAGGDPAPGRGNALRDLLLREELKQLSREADTHLEKEFEGYEQRYPRE